jgi:hypothetical protein
MITKVTKTLSHAKYKSAAFHNRNCPKTVLTFLFQIVTKCSEYELSIDVREPKDTAAYFKTQSARSEENNVK